MAAMNTGAPAQKVMAGTIGAAIASIIVQFLPEVPAGGDLSVALTTVLTFVFGYFTPPSTADQIKD